MDGILSNDLAQRELYGKRRIEFPLKFSPEHKVVTCHYMASAAMFTRLPQSTPWEEDPSLFLVDEDISEIKNCVIWFSRKWANLPETFSKATNLAYTYPGLANPSGVILNPRTRQIMGREENVFFHTADPWKDVPLLQKWTPKIGTTETNFIFDDDGSGAATDPGLVEYTTNWAGKKEVVAKESEIEHYMGDIWTRKTIYVLCR